MNLRKFKQLLEFVLAFGCQSLLIHGQVSDKANLSRPVAVEYNTNLNRQIELNFAALKKQFEIARETGNAPRRPRNINEMVLCFRGGSDLGDRRAFLALGWLYELGWGVPQDETLSFQWFLAAARANDMVGQHAVALRYEQGRGVEKDLGASLVWYRKAADQGNVHTQVLLGLRYEHGINGVTQNFSEAAKWYRMAAEQGHRFAQFSLGLQYARGQGVEQNYAEALKWYLKAAEQGDETAQFNLGGLYARGLGVAQDDVEAVKWNRKAAEQGFALAQVNLGLSYANGLGVPQDFSEARRWYRRAAAQGNPTAQFNLAEHYRVGQGVGQDVIEAYALYNIAAAGGNEEARKMRDAIALVYLKGELLLRAQRRSRELQAEFEVEKVQAASLVQKSSPSFSGREPQPANAEQRSTEAKSTGSGFVVSLSGLVVTNWHVVEKAQRIELVTSRGKVSATVIQVDRNNDLAVLRSESPLPAALPIRSSRGAKIGTDVFSIGFPNPSLQGFSPKFNRGEVSSVAGPGDDPRFFQISVPAQPGNSGGALCDAAGRVVGVVAAKLDERLALQTSGSSPENVNYAIKSTYVLALLESLDLPVKTLPPEDNILLSPEAARERAQEAAVLVLAY